VEKLRNKNGFLYIVYGVFDYPFAIFISLLKFVVLDQCFVCKLNLQLAISMDMFVMTGDILVCTS